MSKAPAIEKGLNATGNAIASGASKVGSAIKGLPLTTQAFLSRFPKEELAKMYEYAKSEANPLEQEFKNWYEQKFTPVNRGDYNNAIAEGLPHELAVQATHRRSDLPQGVWYMKNLFNNNYVPSKMGGLTLDEFNKARETLLGDILPKELSEAQRLGTKYASYFPHTREAWEKLAAHGLGWEGATNWLLHTGLGLKSAGIPVALQSPRVNAEILRTAGKASKYANKAINTLGNYGSKVENALEPVTKPINSALDALLNATPVSVAAQQADPNNPYNVANHAKGGPITPAIPLTLSHPYYRKLNRSN